MHTFTEIVTAVVIHSSAAAYSHFGVPVEAHQVERPAPTERTVARTTAKPSTPAADCPPTRSKSLKT
jgi:hypothetical protein